MTEKTTTDAATNTANSGAGDASKTDTTKTGDGTKSYDTTATKGADSALGAAAGDDKSKGETKADDKKDAAGTKKEEPKALELKLPDGMKADDAKVVAFKKLAGELGLDSEKAQKLFDHDLAQSTAAEDAFNTQDQKWAETWRADPELGGQHADATIKDIRKAFTHFKADEARQLLLAAGLGNHPTIVKTFAAIGRALRDDRIAGTTNGAAGSSQRKSDAEVFYGKPSTTTDTAAS